MSTDISEKASYKAIATNLNKSLASMGFGVQSRLTEETVQSKFESVSLNLRSRPDNVDHRHVDHIAQKGARDLLSKFENLNLSHSVLSPKLRRPSRLLRPR